MSAMWSNILAVFPETRACFVGFVVPQVLPLSFSIDPLFACALPKRCCYFNVFVCKQPRA